MWNGKYVDFDLVIERVYDNPVFNDISYGDALEWAYQAMAKIGTTLPYTSKVTDGNEEINHPDPVLVENYRAAIPHDVYMIEQIRDWETKTPYSQSAYIYHEASNKANTISNELTFTINNSFIFTSNKEGFLEISYWAFPTTCDGKPAIPDSERYIDGIVKYIKYREAEKLWITERLSENKFRYFEQEWLFQVNSAFGALTVPDYAKAELILRNSTRMIQTPNAFNNGFMQLNPQQRYVAFYRNKRWR